MKATRAEEIINSPDVIGVLYRSNDVWLEKVDKGTSKAEVTYMEKGNTITVDIEQLVETGPLKLE